MKYFSSLSKYFPFFAVFTTSIIPYILPKECVVFNTCCAYFEQSWLFCIALLRSLNLVRNMRPILPIHWMGQVQHFVLYMLALL
jgi:hypothetical protein